MESKTKNKQNREVIEAMVKRSFHNIGLAQDEDAIVELKEGWFNVAYNVKLADGRETILKIAPPVDAEVLSYEKNIMSTEVNTMRLASKETDVIVPQVYYYDDKKDICDSDYFFMEKIIGNNYDNVKKDLSETIIKSINQQIGLCLKKVNDIEGRSYFGYDGNPDLQGNTWRETFLKMIDAILDDGKRKQVELICSYDEIYSLIEKNTHYLDAITKPHFVHWDCWDSNVFVREGKVVGILDFERVLWGDILIESIFRFREINQLIGYGKTDFTPEEIVRCKLYDAYLYLVMVIECEYRHYDNDSVLQFGWNNLSDTIDWLRKETN